MRANRMLGYGLLAPAAALFAVHTYTQLIVGQECPRLAGNAERYLPLRYAGFLLGGAVAAVLWHLGHQLSSNPVMPRFRWPGPRRADTWRSPWPKRR